MKTIRPFAGSPIGICLTNTSDKLPRSHASWKTLAPMTRFGRKQLCCLDDCGAPRFLTWAPWYLTLFDSEPAKPPRRPQEECASPCKGPRPRAHILRHASRCYGPVRFRCQRATERARAKKMPMSNQFDFGSQEQAQVAFGSPRSCERPIEYKLLSDKQYATNEKLILRRIRA